MNRRLIAIILAALTVLTLSGCQPAREDKDEAGDDRLIGVFITSEYLDLLDAKGYQNDHMGQRFGGDYTRDDYEGKLYATLTNAETAEAQYIFDDVAGMPFFSAKYPAAEGNEPYWNIDSDEGISLDDRQFHFGDDGDKIYLEGTIYVSPALFGKVYYMNPVYQSADGSVYATSGSGVSVSGTTDEGYISSQTIDETISLTENGESKTASASIKISTSSMYTPNELAILQLDESSNIVARDVFAPDALPQELRTQPSTDYIILETHKSDAEGEAVVTRELFNQGDELLSAFHLRDDGVCVKQWVALIWD